jgi:hypothetical protein
MTTAHSALPYPYPEPPAQVTLVDLRDTVLPRLRSARYILHSTSLAVAREPWRSEDLPAALVRLADDVAKCCGLIDRAPHDELRAAALPKLQSAHCLLGALSLAAARDIVLVEELPHALDDLADKIERCRDLIDRATADV